ncbi:MAG: hypothetical protein JW715_01855 [Sedimentisphaerales bacterium]|nr:hypothetical protein [Sedimentisphaerales bacterium]
MKLNMITKVTFALLYVTCIGCAYSAAANQDIKRAKQAADPVDKVLENLHKKTLELKSYEGRIEWKFIQPRLFDSQDLRKGNLYYVKEGNKSRLRINFETRKQDEEKERKYIEQYLVTDGASLSYPGHKFEGMWLMCIDYQVEELKYAQLTEPNDPNQSTDVFDLAADNLPIVGFSKADELKKQFEVTLVEQKSEESKGFIQVHLKVKPTSVYKDEYTYIDFWIDEKLNLPAKVVAVTTEEDIYEIKFLKPKINQPINRKVFDFEIPKGYDEPVIIPIERETVNDI